MVVILLIRKSIFQFIQSFDSFEKYQMHYKVFLKRTYESSLRLLIRTYKVFKVPKMTLKFLQDLKNSGKVLESSYKVLKVLKRT